MVRSLSGLVRLVAGVLVASVLGTMSVKADVPLWYNGDFDGRDALVNQTGPADGLVYDNFIVPVGQTYHITGVFSNNLMYSPGDASSAYWEIRSGVSAGNGGTLVASGDGADSLSATGRFLDLGLFKVFEYTNLVSVNVVLGAGTYWLAVAPDVSDQNSYISSTSGAGAIGSPPGNDGNSYSSSIFFGDNFVPTSDIEGAGTWDYSMGIIGTAAVNGVPEPSTLLAGMLGMAACAGYAWNRRRSPR